MKVALYNGPHAVEVGEHPHPALKDATDVIVRVVFGCVCGSDLWYYRGLSPHDVGAIGHEFIGIVDELGSEVKELTKGGFGNSTIYVQRRHLCQLCWGLDG